MLWLLALLPSPAAQKPEVCPRYNCVQLSTVSGQNEAGLAFQTTIFQLRPLDLKLEVTRLSGQPYSTAFVLGRSPTQADAKMLSSVLSREWGQTLTPQQINQCPKGASAGAAGPLGSGACLRRGQASIFFKLSATPH